MKPHHRKTKHWKMPRHSWLLPHIFGCGNETVTFISTDKWTIQYQDNVNNVIILKKVPFLLEKIQNVYLPVSSVLLLWNLVDQFLLESVLPFWGQSQSSHCETFLCSLSDLTLFQQGIANQWDIMVHQRCFCLLCLFLVLWKIEIKDFIL